MNLFIIVIRTIFFYFFIMFLYRIMGKREVGQLGVIDLIVSILIAELVAICIENPDSSIMRSVLPVLVLVGLEIVLAYFSLKNSTVRNILDGNPSVIIKNGKLNFSEMVKQKYSLDDLLVHIRDKGYRNIEEIEYAILETSGNLSIFETKENKTPFPLPIILDGVIQKDTLNYLNKNNKWIDNILKKKKLKLEDVFYAFYKENNIFIIKNDELL